MYKKVKSLTLDKDRVSLDWLGGRGGDGGGGVPPRVPPRPPKALGGLGGPWINVIFIM